MQKDRAGMTRAMEVWASPEWYPVAIEQGTRQIQFVRMSPHTYRASVFLDSRICHLGETCTVGVEDLLLARPPAPAEPVRVHYIFHTAFCCSTLLARYLELLPYVLVLKEPGLLSRVALMTYESGDAWRETATLTLALLTRTYAADQAIAIKASDWSNGIADFALAADSTATATFQMVSLRQFVLAVIKSPWRRGWAHARVQIARRDAERMGCLTHVATSGLTDGQTAAFVWLVNAALCRSLTAGVHARRVGLVDANEVAARPGPCLMRVLAASGLDRPDTDVSSLVANASRAYSKEQRRAFDAAARAAELRRLGERWGPEADAAVSWAMGVDPATSTALIRPFART